MLTIVCAIVIAWLVIAAIPSVLSVVLWMLVAIADRNYKRAAARAHGAQ